MVVFRIGPTKLLTVEIKHANGFLVTLGWVHFFPRLFKFFWLQVFLNKVLDRNFAELGSLPRVGHRVYHRPSRMAVVAVVKRRIETDRRKFSIN